MLINMLRAVSAMLKNNENKPETLAIKVSCAITILDELIENLYKKEPDDYTITGLKETNTNYSPHLDPEAQKAKKELT